MKKKIAFIINPISGGVGKKHIPGLISRIIDLDLFDIEIKYTESPKHNTILAKEAVEQRKDVVVAVGGDGTINHIAAELANTGIAMGIVPKGSGNGLSRHLGIPMNEQKALALINQMHTRNIDAGTSNDTFFVNVAGAGFDAHVSHLFATAPKRGFWSYTKITLGEFARYKPAEYEMILDGKPVKREAFIICVANGSQYGNNAYIAPEARPDDGLFDISVLKPFRVHQMPAIGLQLFMKSFANSKYVDTFRAKHVVIKRNKAEVCNIDGEPVMQEKDLDIRILPGALKMIVPNEQ